MVVVVEVVVALVVVVVVVALVVVVVVVVDATGALVGRVSDSVTFAPPYFGSATQLEGIALPFVRPFPAQWL